MIFITKTSNKASIALAFFTVAINGIIGHFFAPNGMTFTPIVIIITTALTVFATKGIPLAWKSFFIYFFIAINDILIKLYSGGLHDYEGLGWVQLYLLVGLVPTSVMLFITTFKAKDEPVISKVMALLLFVLLMILHFQLFSHLGLGRYYPID